ncbi:MAG TPA: hypothetical protein VHV77_06885 [Pirellulales bacterium]|jgi:hypothetical protein|nr:hypothetical protein [Pirellulales bacterium]
MNSYTITEALTFSVTHARQLASKVATDLKRVQRFYGAPDDETIADYETELTSLIKDGYVSVVWYGFRRGDVWIEPTLKYTARELAGSSAADDDPGRIRAGADVSGAYFTSYLLYTYAWGLLPSAAQIAYKAQLPFQRSGAPEPGVSGYLQSDRTYSAGGRALERMTVRSTR